MWTNEKNSIVRNSLPVVTLTILINLFALFLDSSFTLAASQHSSWSQHYKQELLTEITSSDDLFKNGFIDASRYPGVDPTGIKDSTRGLQQAINDGIKKAKATYLPEGIYSISNTLSGLQIYDSSGCASFLRNYLHKGNSIRQAAVLVGGLNGNRPIIRLRDKSPGFGQVKEPKPVIKFTNSRAVRERDVTWQGGTDCNMGAVIRGIEINVGSGNPGSIGIVFPAAQYSTLENVKINATGGYAGIKGVPTVNVNLDIEVIGGKYGILPEICCGISFVGLKLRNQRVASIGAKSYSSIGITGFDIEISQGSAIELMDGGDAHSSQLVLLDGKILNRGKSVAIDNKIGNDLHINNVYIKGSPNLIAEPELKVLGIQNQWNHIAEYNYTDQRVLERNTSIIESHKLIDGKMGKSSISVLNKVTLPPDNLLSRHTPTHIPSPFGRYVFNVVTDGEAKADGKSDDTQAIQKAIDTHKVVFLPAGDYQLSQTLKLKKDTQIFGVPGGKSRLFAKNWMPETFTAMIETENSATASTYIGDVYIKLPKGKRRTYLSALKWNAGNNSWVRHLYVDMAWSDGDYAAHGRKLIEVSGQGGGRFYGTTIHLLSGGNNSRHKNHRLLYIYDTEQPITFYGTNMEHSKTTQIEIQKAKNVRMIGGMKFEAFDALTISDSENIMISGLTGHATFMKVKNSDKVLIPVFNNYAGLKSKVKSRYMFTETYKGKHHRVNAEDNLSLFKRGEFDFDRFTY